MQIDFNAANQEAKAPVGATFENPDEPFTVNPFQAGVPSEEPSASMVQLNPLDLAVAKAKLFQHEAKINTMLEEAKKFKVVDEKTNQEAVEKGIQSNKLLKAIEKIKLNLTQDARDYTSTVNNFAKVFSPKLNEIVRVYKSEIGAYSDRVEMERREAERKAQEAAKKLQDEINKEAKEKKIEPVQFATPVLTTKAQPTRTAAGSSSTRKDWKWEVTDIAEVPREYLMIDAVKINKAVKAGLRNVKGLKIFEKSTVAFRG